MALVEGDCVEFLERVPAGSVDLILTDPPYEISRDTGFKNFKKGEERFAVSMDFGQWDRAPVNIPAVLRECFRVLRTGGTAIVFYDLWKVSPLADELKRAGFKQLRFIEWIKTNPVPLNSSRNYLTNAREIALVAIKGGRPTFHSTYDNGVYSYGICRDAGRFHPTQKPLQLMEELVNKHSNEGDLVLDCFAGSGTTAIAAAALNRNFIGCERDPDYHRKAIERMKRELMGRADVVGELEDVL